MENIYEVQRIKQVKTEMEIKENSIRMSENAADIARAFIGDDDREVLLVLCLNTKKGGCCSSSTCWIIKRKCGTSKGSSESCYT